MFELEASESIADQSGQTLSQCGALSRNQDMYRSCMDSSCRVWRSAARVVLMAIALFLLVICPSLLSLGVSSAQAEGTRDLVANGGYRPYTERYNSSTLGQQRLSVMHVYLKAGETVYFGTSVADAKLYETNDNKNSDWLFSNTAMGTSYSDAQLAFVNTADIYITQGEYSTIADAIAAGKTPGKDGVTLIDLADSATSSTPGYIYDSAQEAGGVDLTGTGAGYKVTSDNTISTSTSGYVAGVKTNANTFIAPSSGIYTVVFFSQKHSGDNPTKCKVSDLTAFKTTQKGGTIASWDISVYSGSTLQTGRVFTSALFINMGGNVLSGGVSQGSLYSTVYAVTDDGYQYRVNFNGMDPFGFVFFANNRGLLSTSDGSSSLYHGVRSDNNTLSDMESHGIALNNTPYNGNLDHTYNLFYETPSSDALGALNIGDPSTGAGSISNFKFTGTGDATADQGYVGKGGTFSFDASSDISATSYQIELDFSSIGGGTVVLSNALTKGANNSITWDGKDANGKVVPAGTYGTLSANIKLKGGEVHFPLLDVEQNPNGIIITRLNGSNPDSMVYFNNSATNAGDTTAPWTLAKNWQVGNETDATAGVDSSAGAMAFTNVNTANKAKGMTLLGDGDQSALDVWAYYNTTASLGTWTFSLVDASFTVTKVWDNTAGTPASGNPANVTMTLQQSSDNGATWSDVTTDDAGAAIANPVTWDTTTSTPPTYTWTGLDPSKTYQVVETAITGYTTTYGPVGKAVITDSGQTVFSQTVTNAYTQTKLTISKIWNHGSSDEEPQTDWPTSVTVHVYTDAAKTHEITGSPFTLTSASTDESGNTWATTITGLDPTASYYCYEDAVTGYTSSSGGQASGSAATGYRFTFTNTFDSSTYVTAQVLKQWSGDTIDGVSYRPSSVTMTLINKDTKAAITTDGLGHNINSSVTLSDANSWYYAWPMLAKTDASGKAINYTIVETTPAGYTATTEPADPPLVLGNLTSVIWDNAYQTTSFTVAKTWVNGTNGANQPQTVDVQLQQSLDGGTTYTDYGSPVTLSKDSKDAADNPWATTWTGLPSYTTDSKQILYRATETAVDGYTTTYGVVSGSAAGGYTQTITNTYAQTSFTITKVWDHGTQAAANQPTSISVQLQQSVDGGTTYTDYGDKVTLTADDADADGNWLYTVSDLPASVADGTSILYRAVESTVSGYTTTYGDVSGGTADGFAQAITNTYAPTTLTITKIWNNGTNPNQPGSVTMNVYSDASKTNLVYTYNLTADDVDSDGNWSHTFRDVDPSLTYYVYESALDGYTAGGEGAVNGDASKGFTSTITNTFNDSNYTTVEVKKTWDMSGVDISYRPSSVQMTLVDENGNKVTTDALGNAIKNPVTLSDANSWYYAWNVLPRGLDYDVVEQGSDGYMETESAPVTTPIASLSASATSSAAAATAAASSAAAGTTTGAASEAAASEAATSEATTSEAAAADAATPQAIAPEAVSPESLTAGAGSVAGAQAESLTDASTPTDVSGASAPGDTGGDAGGNAGGDAGGNAGGDAGGDVSTGSTSGTDAGSTADPTGSTAGSTAGSAAGSAATPAAGSVAGSNTAAGSASSADTQATSALAPEADGNLVTIDITNTYMPTTFTVTKVWNHGVNTDPADQPTSVVIQLQQSVDGGKTYVDFGDKVTLTSANVDSAGNWTYEWSPLPSELTDGSQALYRAVETAVSGYSTDSGTATYALDPTGDTGGTWTQTITNTYSSSEPPTPTPGNVTPPSTPTTLPRTGDVVRIWTIVGIGVAVLAVALIAAAIVVSRRKGRNKK